MRARNDVELATKGAARRFILEAPGYLRIEVSKDGGSEAYPALAVICGSGRVRRVLLVADGDHSSGEHELREALSAMLLVGLATDFRLAFVAASAAIADCYRQTIGDLRLAGVDA